MRLTLGVNLGFAINRYIEPEVWPRVVLDMGLTRVQFVADLLNPFWPEAYVENQLERLEKSLRETGVKVDSIFTSSQTRWNFQTHSDAEARRFYHEWLKKMLSYGARLGAKSGGANFGAMSFAAYDNEDTRSAIIDEAVTLWQKLCDYAAGLGYEALIIEPMSVKREFATTVDDTLYLLDRVNANAQIPLKVNLDVGHAPDPSERDPYPWIERLGSIAPVVHLQQTVLHKSLHQPFLPEYNAAGIIEPQKVLSALERGGCKETMLTFELSHREHADTDERVIEDHRVSVEYWKREIEKSGTWKIED